MIGTSAADFAFYTKLRSDSIHQRGTRWTRQWQLWHWW
jgi:hypothetical protein